MSASESGHLLDVPEGSGASGALGDEFAEDLLALPAANVRVERIVSRGHASPAGFWYDQAETEWVLLVSGRARLEFEGNPAETVELEPGSWVTIRPHRRHRVAWTDPGCETVWLAVWVA